MATEAHAVEFHDEEQQHEHPSPRKYVFIAVILAIVTAIEVAIYYFDLAEGLLVAFLLFFGVIKFVMVGMYFMHLKFDHKVFRMLFITGIVFAVSLFTVVLTNFATRGGPAPEVTDQGE
jgi:cytochrome c oxidase subunit 4